MSTVKAIPKQVISRLPYLSSLLRGGTDDERAFLSDVRDQLGGEGVHCIPIGRARTGLYLLVKSAVREGRNKVLLSPCTIPDAVNMVRLGGGVPVFVDYVERSTNMDLDQFAKQLTEDVACAIVTHYHVNQAALPPIRALCERRGVPLFDDCALAFGGSMEGRPVGDLTTASVFSFSAFKTLNYFWGGLITTRDADLAQALRAETESWPRLTYADYLAGAKNVSIYYLSTLPLVFRLLTFPQLQRRARASSGAVELPYTRIEHRAITDTLASRPSPAAFAHWRRKLGFARKQVAHRREIAAIYRSCFGDRMLSAETEEAVMAGSCFVNFPLWVDARARDAIHRSAMLAGYDLGKSLYPNTHDTDPFRDCAGSSERAGALVRSALYLPTHAGVTPAYARELAGVVSDLLQRFEPAGAASPLREDPQPALVEMDGLQLATLKKA
jgi:perosamine synthetase